MGQGKGHNKVREKKENKRNTIDMICFIMKDNERQPIPKLP